jgi:uncharacterized protein
MQSVANTQAIHPDRRGFLLAHPVLAYFMLTFAMSWLGALAVVSPAVLRGHPVPQLAGFILFPVMLLGPALAGIFMTAATKGRGGLRLLGRRMTMVRISFRWYAVLLLPFALVLGTLSVLSGTVSHTFSPNHFYLGASFGLIAGFMEEVGWTGFAFPAMTRTRSALPAAIWLGVLWGLWHAPAIDFLGAARPHGRYLIPYFIAFIAVMVPMRVLICWTFVHTRSVFLAQLLHTASTGALVVLSPRVTPAQETLWYLAYAFVLWSIVAVIVAKSGRTLRRSSSQAHLKG